MKAAIEATGLTQRAVAPRLGISKGYQVNWNNRKERPPSGKAQDLSSPAGNPEGKESLKGDVISEAHSVSGSCSYSPTAARTSLLS